MTRADEWQQYKGAGMPVNYYDQVQVKIRDGSISSSKAGWLNWDQSDRPDDIIEYRVLEKRP